MLLSNTSVVHRKTPELDPYSSGPEEVVTPVPFKERWSGRFINKELISDCASLSKPSHYCTILILRHAVVVSGSFTQTFSQ